MLADASAGAANVDIKQLGAVGNGIADDTASIQNALDGGNRTVLMPAGTYKISAALKVDSHTTIKADPKAIIRLADHAGTNVGVFLLTNRDVTAGNTDITVDGGIWDGNNEHNPRGREGDPNGYTGAAINFVNVRHLALRNLTVRNPEAFSIRLCEVEDFTVEDICFDHTVIRPNQDGVHVNGFCLRGVIRNLRALTPRTTNDDMVALNADDATDRVINLGMKCGPIRDITVENLHADDAWTLVRLLSFKQLIENIAINNVSGGCRVNAINLDRWRFPAGAGNIRNVTLRNFTVRKMPDPAVPAFAKMPLIPIQSAVRGLRIENFRRDDDLPAPTLVVDNGRQNRLRLEGATAEQTGGKVVLPRGGFSSLTLDSAGNGDAFSIGDRIGPVAKGTGFAMDGWFVWCGSVIKVGGQYHMFASRWPVETKFPEGYRQNSEIVRAVASRPEGPYKFQEVVIGKREPGKWDSGMAHNPAIYKVGDTFVLYHNASDVSSRYRQIGIATAPAVTGPWTRRDKPLDLGLAADANNPAACFEPDGSVRLFWRTVDLHVCISVARSFEGPYKLVNDNVWPKARLEDFFFFKHAGEYHVVCEDNAGSVTGHERWGAHLSSPDGIRNWKPWPQPIAYDHTIRWTDGSELKPVRRERPWFLIEDGKLTHLFTAVYDGQRTWNQPVPLVPALAIKPSAPAR